jgi:hypothetical protein
VRPPARALAGALLAAAAALALAAGAGAEVRRFEVVGAVPIAPGSAGSLRHAALRAALAEAALRAAAGLVEAESGKPPPDLGGALGSKPDEYAVSYRVLEDRGEQPALLTAQDPAAREYVVVAEVQVDVGRVRERLREQGRLPAEAPAPAGPTRFQLELLDLPSAAAWTAARRALAGAGARVVPLELEPRRALVEVSGVPEALALERLRTAELPSGLWIEPLPAEAPGAPARARVQRGPPPAPPEGSTGAPAPPEQAPPEAIPLEAPSPAPAEAPAPASPN